MGMMARWLQLSAELDLRRPDEHKDPLVTSQARYQEGGRRDARAWLKSIPGYAELAACERPKFDDEEHSEPYEVP